MKKLEYYRRQKGYSFQKMAEIVNISKTFYWQIEKSKRRLSYEMAVKISGIFNLKPDDLFYDEYYKQLEKEEKK